MMITNYLVAANLGIMIFFSVAVAPGIFKYLPQEWAAIYVRKFFPKYYAFLGSVTLIAAFFSNESQNRYFLFAIGLLFFVTLLVVAPMVNNAKDTGQNSKFYFLHMLSVVINLLEMAVFFYVLI